MNAGRDVERLIADWLDEEAPGRAPDRILDLAGLVIDQTRQRRFVAEWREPMYVTLRGLLAGAAVVVVVIAGVAFAARGGVPGTTNPNQTPVPTMTGSPTPSATPDALSALVAYRAARDAICQDFANTPPIPDVLDWKADPEATAEFLAAVIARGDELIARLSSLEPPTEIAAAHAANVQAGRDTVALLEHELELVQSGDIDAALAVDVATGPLSAQFEQFEQQNGLVPCP